MSLALALPGVTSAQESQANSANGNGAAASPMRPEEFPRPVARAHQTGGSMVIDGRLDEAGWADAEVITGFIQAQPAAGLPATERTVVRILFDENTLYISAECFDSDPSALIVPSLEQDFESGNSDILGFTLDTYHDRRNAFMFLFNPRGAVKEAQNYGDSRFENAAWEGVIDVQTRIHEEGWTLEVAIPFSTLRFDPSRAEQVWGLQVLRRIRRKNEDTYWAPMDRRNRIHRMSQAGTLHGLEGIRAGRNLSIKPYVLSSVGDGSAVGPDPDFDADVGLDLKYGVTPGMTLDLTYRTDFSQVEVDQEQVNLTRFSLFFPERRDFFIENSGFFTLGDVTERNYRSGSSLRDFTVFHSRRIGLEGGRPVPIIGGGRLSGRMGEFELGFLDMQTRAGQGLPAENFAVARVRRNLPRNGDIGAVFVNRQSTEGPSIYNRTYGADANVRPHPNVAVNSYLLATDDSEVSGSRWAGRLAVGWRDQLLNATAFVKQVGDAFVPRAGFVRRNGIRHTYATVGVHPRPDWPLVLELNPYVEMDYITNLESVLETRDASFGFSATFTDGSGASVAVHDRFERLFEPFDVLSSAVVEPGDYDFREVSGSYRTSAGRALSGQVQVSRGGFYDGDRSSISAGVLWRPSYQLSFDLSAQHNAISFPQESLTADVFGGRVVYAASTRLFASAFVQYNRASGEMVSNARLNFIHSPLSDLFVVFTERRNVDAGGVLERFITLKATKYLSF